MFGYVDANDRPVLAVTFWDPAGQLCAQSDAVIDTGFQFAAILPRTIVASLSLALSHFITARFADGRTARLDVYPAMIDWLGGRRAILIAESAVQMPLLGSALLYPHMLIIDYGQRTVEIR